MAELKARVVPTSKPSKASWSAIEPEDNRHDGDTQQESDTEWGNALHNAFEDR